MTSATWNFTSADRFILEQTSLLNRLMYGIGVLELIICVLGTPANALVLHVAIWLSRKGGATAGGKQQWFVASMTAADFLFTSVHSPMFFALYALGRRFDRILCSLFYLVSHVAIVSSSVTLLLINIDKFIALHKPLHYPLLMTSRRVSLLIVSFWLISLIWALFLVFGPFLTVENNCDPTFKPGHQILYYAFAVVFFALPVFVSVLMAIFVIVIARRSRMSNLRVGAGPGKHLASRWLLELEMSSKTENGDGRGGRGRVRQERTKNVKAITFVVTTTLWSAVTLLPYRFAFILNFSGYAGVLWPSIFLAMTTMNALGNPFITIATQRQYRNRIRRLWNWMRCRQSLADNDLLSQHVAATIRMLCQQQEQLITAASRRSAKLRASLPSNTGQSLLSSSLTGTVSPDDIAQE